MNRAGATLALQPLTKKYTHTRADTHRSMHVQTLTHTYAHTTFYSSHFSPLIKTCLPSFLCNNIFGLVAVQEPSPFPGHPDDLPYWCPTAPTPSVPPLPGPYVIKVGRDLRVTESADRGLSGQRGRILSHAPSRPRPPSPTVPSLSSGLGRMPGVDAPALKQHKAQRCH